MVCRVAVVVPGMLGSGLDYEDAQNGVLPRPGERAGKGRLTFLGRRRRRKEADDDEQRRPTREVSTLGYGPLVDPL